MNLENTKTLGMEMMKALCKELGGEFKIENKASIRISIEFNIENILPGARTYNLYTNRLIYTFKYYQNES